MSLDNWSSKYIHQKDIVCRNIAGETILVPIRGNLADMQYIFTLNPVGAYIWDQLDGENKLTQILDMIVERFDTTRDQAETDILEFIDQVVDKGLVTEKS